MCALYLHLVAVQTHRHSPRQYQKTRALPVVATASIGPAPADCCLWDLPSLVQVWTSTSLEGTALNFAPAGGSLPVSGKSVNILRIAVNMCQVVPAARGSQDAPLRVARSQGTLLWPTCCTPGMFRPPQPHMSHCAKASTRNSSRHRCG